MATKIPLNFMWADEAILLEDIQRKISADMVKWANAFYGHLDTKFALDINPAYPITMARASKYALVKNGGVEPDLRPRAEIVEAEQREEERLSQQMDEKDKELEDLDKRESLLTELISTIDREQADLHHSWENTTDAQERARIKAELARARQERVSADAAKESVNKTRKNVELARDEVRNKWFEMGDKVQDRYEVVSGDRMLRIQMALRYVLEGIGSESRINVIFCKPKVSSGKHQAIGEARRPLLDEIEVLPGQFLLWPYPYIIIDLSPGQRKVLAHELVHLAGRSHPPARKLYMGIKKIPLLNIGLPTFEEVPGGFFDGPEKDIMNYTRQDPEASDTTMRKQDQERLRDFLEALATK